MVALGVGIELLRCAFKRNDFVVGVGVVVAVLSRSKLRENLLLLAVELLFLVTFKCCEEVWG